MARDLGLTKLQFHMDNNACIEVLQNANHHGGECAYLLSACRYVEAMMYNAHHM